MKISFKTKIFILIIFFGLFGLAKSSFAASYYYVDNSVGSSGNGTPGSPWKNFSDINWATISGASKPCTIYISGGATSQSYSVAAAYNIGASGTGIGSEVIIKRPTSTEWSGHSGTVITQGGATDYTFYLVGGRSYVIIDGLELNPGNFWIEDSNHITIRNCWIHNWAAGMGDNDGGITTHCGSSPCTYLTVQNNRIGPPGNTATQDPVGLDWNDHYLFEGNIIEYSYDVTSGSHADGIHEQGASSNLAIRYNWFRGGFLNAAIFLDAEPGNNQAQQDADIYGNIFENSYDPGTNGWQGILVYSGGPYPNHTLNIYNNVFANIGNTNDNTWSGMALWATGVAGDNVKTKNNIFYNSKISLDGTLTGWDVDYNRYYNSSGYENGKIIEWQGNDYTSLSTFHTAHSTYETNGHQGDPQLANLAYTFTTAHDFRPAIGSPVIDAGYTTGSPYAAGISTATAGSNWPYYAGSGNLGVGVTTISRPQGSAWDIGAYEYQSGGDTTPPAAPSGLSVN